MDSSTPSRRAPPAGDPFAALEQKLGFLPNLFRAQACLPRVVAAEAGIADAVVFSEGVLGRRLKEALLVAVAATRKNVYCTTAHAHILTTLGEDPSAVSRLVGSAPHERMTAAEREILSFGLLLGSNPLHFGPAEIDRLRKQGIPDEGILETILTVSLARFLCTLAEGLGPVPDFPPAVLPADPPVINGGASGEPHAAGPYLAAVESEDTRPVFEFFREHFGFVPNIFRAQTLLPEVLSAEVEAIRSILLNEEVLPRRMKEFILLVVSARNLNTYCVAVHCELLRGLGVATETSDQIALDHTLAGLPPEESALLDLVVRLQNEPESFGLQDMERARTHGWSHEQLVEAIVMAALSNFLNTLQCGLGPIPDFAPRLRFEADNLNLSVGRPHPTDGGAVPAERQTVDPDAALVARAREGDLQAFEELVVKHSARVYRVLLGVTASPDDAEDGTQEVFIKALQAIGKFRGSSRFSTWLTRIAINEGLERVRSRRAFEPLGAEDTAEEAFQPRNVARWMDDPEAQFSRAESRRLVEREILELPLRYRSAVLLRDIAQLSTAAAAEAMGLGIATFKTRLLRGRLMLREALAPHFTRPAEGKRHV